MSSISLKDSFTSILTKSSSSKPVSPSSSNTRKSVTFDKASRSSDDDDFYETTTSGRRFSVLYLRKVEDFKFDLSCTVENYNLLLFLIYALLCVNWLLMGFQEFLDAELKPQIDCNIPGVHNGTWTYQEKKNITTPKTTQYKPGCMYYDYEYYLLSLLNYEQALEAISNFSNTSRIIFCKNYKIIKDIPTETSFVMEFGLVCYNKILHLNSVYLKFGHIFFAFPAGIWADMYGRRPVHIICASLASAMAFIISISTNYGIFVLGKMIIGGCLLSINILLNMIYSETCRRKYRMFTTIFASIWFVIGSANAHEVYNNIEVWRLRELAFAIFFLICLFGAIMIIPESPRYLIAKMQFCKAWDCLDTLGNTDTHPTDLENAMLYYNLLFQMRILTKWYLLRRILITVVLNGVSVFFYNLFKNIAMKVLLKDTIDGSKMQFIGIQVAVTIFTAGIIWIYKWKKIICFYNILLSMSIAVRLLTESDIIMDLSILSGIIFSEILFIVTYCYLIDIFPTTHRGTAVGFCFSLNSILAVLAQAFHNDLVIDRGSTILGMIYCGICITCAMVTTISPEVGGDLPNRKHEMFQKLVIEEPVRSSSSS